MAELGANHDQAMTFDVAEGGDHTVTVRLAGELDITNIDALASGVAPALERGPQRMVVDVSGLRFADSSAIALWVRWAGVVPEIELRDVPPLLRRVVESMGLAETLNVTP
ncbi:MAG TPA: STAS domain-containing protein [Solirubrobacteraceae bacterium]|nr:STAS domain-containing protein [Solirubrobacteraceae bacterium]